jgi:hypothetical protein
MGLVFKLEKDKTKEEVYLEITKQLNLIKDPDLLNRINGYLIAPVLHLAMWDYSETETKFPAWLIMESKVDQTGILYSEYGFGFGDWGIVDLSKESIHFGPDFGWFPTLKEAFLDSWMAEKDNQ